MTHPIQLIVGLGNPGPQYAQTRHNAGAWMVEMLAEQQRQTLKPENKFFGLVSKVTIANSDCYLLIPTQFMNRSGQSVKAIAHFYKIEPEAILIAHDELDLAVGDIRYKQGGGDGGHNGLKDISAHLGNKNYWRLRIGIGHPGHRDQVHDYVLSKPSRSDHQSIITAIEASLMTLDEFVSGNKQKAIQALHTQNLD